jgi:uncharacterized protein YxjI
MTDGDEDTIPRVFRLPESLAKSAPYPWIEDAEGERWFQVDERALAVLETLILRDLHGREAAKLRQRNLRGDDATDIEREGATVATVRRVRAGLRHHFVIDVQNGASLDVHGQIARHEYEIRREPQVIATISQRWFRGPYTYGVEIAPDEDVSMILAATIAIEAMN